MRHIVRAFLNLIYPLRCEACGKVLECFNSLTHLCSLCWDKIQLNPPPYCLRCGKPLSYKGICNECCWGNRRYFHRAWSAGLYEGVLKHCILRIKYNRKSCLINPLSQLMVDFAKRNLDIGSIDLIVPVPLHRARRLERGFNQADALAHCLSKATGIRVSGCNLERQRPTKSQSHLTKKERFQNVKDAFRIKARYCLDDKAILLIDDVLTTGATVSECARLLRGEGAKRVDVLTLARGR